MVRGINEAEGPQFRVLNKFFDQFKRFFGVPLFIHCSGLLALCFNLFSLSINRSLSIRNSIQVGISLLFLICLAFFCFGNSAFALGASWDQLSSLSKETGTARVIVRLKENRKTDALPQSAENLQSLKDRISKLQNDFLESFRGADHTISDLRHFSYVPYLGMSVDASTFKALQENDQIQDIQEERWYRPSLGESSPLIGAPTVWEQNHTGNGWAVAVLDTGVDYTHSFFDSGNKLVSEACYSTSFPTFGQFSVCPNAEPFSTAPGSGLHCNANDPSLNNAGCDHGSHVAGIAVGHGPGFGGVGKEADLIAIQVFSKITDSSFCGFLGTPCISASTSDLVSALERVLTLSTQMKIAAVNMSLGGGAFNTVCDSDDPSIKAVIDLLNNNGVAAVAASGNESQANNISSPACLSNVISVGSTTKTDTVSSFSNAAPILDLLAPGTNILSSTPGNNFETFDGTSMASPQVAGAFSLLRHAEENLSGTNLPSNTGNLAVGTLLDLLKTTGVPVNDTRNGLTFPRIQIDSAIDEFGTLPSITGPSIESTLVGSGETVPITFSASSAQGNELAFAWTATCPNMSGARFSSTDVASPDWTAPINLTGQPQTCLLTVDVSEGGGLNVSGQLALIVSPPVNFGEDKGRRVIAPYWQSDATSYTFITVSHPSLSAMSSQIGVRAQAVIHSGKGLFGPMLEFTISKSSTRRIFIVEESNESINAGNLPSAEFIAGPAESFHGQVLFHPVSSHPEQLAGAEGTQGRGYPDINALSYWGVVVIAGTSTGFAMEFIGDLQDSSSVSGSRDLSSSGLN